MALNARAPVLYFFTPCLGYRIGEGREAHHRCYALQQVSGISWHGRKSIFRYSPITRNKKKGDFWHCGYNFKSLLHFFFLSWRNKPHKTQKTARFGKDWFVLWLKPSFLPSRCFVLPTSFFGTENIFLSAFLQKLEQGHSHLEHRPLLKFQ